MRWYLKVLRNYVTFSGRASRQEFWMFVLFNVLIAVGLHVLDRRLGLGHDAYRGVLSSLYALVVFLPGLAVAVRRMHDIGKSGWFLIAAFIPLVGGFMLLYWYVLDGNPGENAYGPSPKSGQV